MDLYSFFRSSAAYRVRIALNHKGLDYNTVPVHFRKEGGQHKKPEYLALNPQGLLPTLVDGDNVIPQSMAIIEYLDEVYPDTPLLPKEPGERAIVRAMAQCVACDVHPLNNLRVLNYLRKDLELPEEAVVAWIHRWIAEGFEGLEKLVEKHGGECCFGDQITQADLCLVPQVFNARRFETDLSPYPRLCAITDRLAKLPAFEKAAPGNQPDAE